MPRAVVCREFGPPERLRLEELPSQPLRQGEVRVAIRAAGINFPDILMVAGEYQLKPELPFTPGVEAAGDVVEVDAAARGVTVGDRVIVRMRHGAYTEEAVVPPSQLTPMPRNFDYAEGATFLAAHGTAYHALVDRGQLAEGEVLLVHGAGGGVGLAAVEIGKLLGATVIAAASSDEKLAVAQAKGADHLINYAREPFRDAVKRITGRGADVVFDPVGGETFESSLRCIAWGARLLVIGFTGGIGLARTNLLLIKGASVLGVRAGEAARKNPALAAERTRALLEWAEAGRIRANVSHRLLLRKGDGLFAPAQSHRTCCAPHAYGLTLLCARLFAAAEKFFNN